MRHDERAGVVLGALLVSHGRVVDHQTGVAIDHVGLDLVRQTRHVADEDDLRRACLEQIDDEDVAGLERVVRDRGAGCDSAVDRRDGLVENCRRIRHPPRDEHGRDNDQQCDGDTTDLHVLRESTTVTVAINLIGVHEDFLFVGYRVANESV